MRRGSFWESSILYNLFLVYESFVGGVVCGRGGGFEKEMILKINF